LPALGGGNVRDGEGQVIQPDIRLGLFCAVAIEAVAFEKSPLGLVHARLVWRGKHGGKRNAK
jgi:hypothetical protein